MVSASASIPTSLEALRLLMVRSTLDPVCEPDARMALTAKMG